MDILNHRWREGAAIVPEAPFPGTEAGRVSALLRLCPAADETPLVEAPDLAADAAVARFWVKDERARMGLGSFKALGAAYVIARHAAEAGADPGPTALAGRTYVTASAGNHGLSVAAGARIFGARAVVYLSETVPADFARRLAGQGAEVRRAGADYEASMAAAGQAASDNGWTLLSDSSWPGYTDLPLILMEGYLRLAEETVRQLSQAPTHVFLQAGVGGMAGALAAYFRAAWGDAPRIVVVEPEAAPALMESIRAGRPVTAPGPVSVMGRLDCKDPSLIALNGLARDADAFVTLSDGEVSDCLPRLAGIGLATTASGAAGVACALSAPARDALAMTDAATVLCILSEAAGS